MIIRIIGRSATVLVVGFLLGWMARNSDVVEAQGRTPFIVTRIFTGADGQARSEQVEIKLTPGKTQATGASIDSSDPVAVSQIQVLRTPPGYVAEWHPVGRRHYVVMVSGRREIEVAEGKKISFAPGSVMLVEDVTGKGHFTRGVGTEDAISLVIPIADSK